jgi:hypothetical protein
VVIEVKATSTRAVAPASKKAPDPSKTKINRARSLDRRRAVRRPSWGENPVTDNRWELAVVTLVAIAVFFSVWHLVAPLIG